MKKIKVLKKDCWCIKESSSTSGIDLSNLFKDVYLEHNLD